MGIDFAAARERAERRAAFVQPVEIELLDAADLAVAPRTTLADILRQCSQSVDPDVVVVESLLPGGR